MVSKCTMCDNDADDIIAHIGMSCQHYLQERNSFFDIIVNILPVELSVSFFDQSDSEVLTCVSYADLPTGLHIQKCINDELLVELILNVCEYINRKWNFNIPKPYLS